MSKKVVRKSQPIKKVKYKISPVGEKHKKANKKIVHQLFDENTIIGDKNNNDYIADNLIDNKNIMETETIQEVEKPKLEISNPEIKTQDSNSMLDDLMSETDKDSEPANENETENFENEIFENETEKENSEQTQPSYAEATEGKNVGDRLVDTLNSDAEDWQNPSDFRKMCAVNAMMYVEGGAILLSFLGQMISGDWSSEGEKKYTPSEERRKLIRNPLAKKFELNKDRSKSTPTGALITAIIFTILPIVIVAFKDRKARIDIETKNIENNRLKQELAISNAEVERLKTSQPIQQTQSFQKPLEKFLIKKRGRHKLDCDCEKCNMKRMKTEKKKSYA